MSGGGEDFFNPGSDDDNWRSVWGRGEKEKRINGRADTGLERQRSNNGEYIGLPIMLYWAEIRTIHPIHAARSCLPSHVFVNRASYRRWRNNDVTSHEREVTMMLRQVLRTVARTCLQCLAFCLTWLWHEWGVWQSIEGRWMFWLKV